MNFFFDSFISVGRHSNIVSWRKGEIGDIDDRPQQVASEVLLPHGDLSYSAEAAVRQGIWD